MLLNKMTIECEAEISAVMQGKGAEEGQGERSEACEYLLGERSGRGNSRCKGPEADTCLRVQRLAGHSVAGAKRAREEW